MFEPCRTYDTPQTRASRLYGLGLEEETIVQIVRAAITARNGCSALHPPGFAGYTQWGEGVYEARRLLMPRAWVKDDEGNFARVVSPDGLVAITVATGDLSTGKPGVPFPKTAHPRGRETSRAIEINRQPSLFDQPGFEGVEHEVVSPVGATWTLLIFVDDEEVRYELSLGRDQDDQKRICDWADRIIFPAMPLDPAAIDDDADEDPGDIGIDVPVTRR